MFRMGPAPLTACVVPSEALSAPHPAHAHVHAHAGAGGGAGSAAAHDAAHELGDKARFLIRIENACHRWVFSKPLSFFPSLKQLYPCSGHCVGIPRGP